MTKIAFKSDSHNSLMMESAEEHFCSNCATYLDGDGKCSCDFGHYETEYLAMDESGIESQDLIIATKKGFVTNGFNTHGEYSEAKKFIDEEEAEGYALSFKRYNNIRETIEIVANYGFEGQVVVAKI